MSKSKTSNLSAKDLEALHFLVHKEMITIGNMTARYGYLKNLSSRLAQDIVERGKDDNS